MKQSFKSKVFREIKRHGPVNYVVNLDLTNKIFEVYCNGRKGDSFFLLGTMDYLSRRYGLNPLPKYDFMRLVRSCDGLFKPDPETLADPEGEQNAQGPKSPIPEFARFGIYVDESEFVFIDTLQKDKDRLH